MPTCHWRYRGAAQKPWDNRCSCPTYPRESGHPSWELQSWRVGDWDSCGCGVWTHWFRRTVIIIILLFFFSPPPLYLSQENKRTAKVDVSVCLINRHVIKGYVEMAVYLHAFLTSTLGGDEWSASCPWRCTSQYSFWPQATPVVTLCRNRNLSGICH